MFKQIPWPSRNLSVSLLRLMIAVVFLLHAVVRLTRGSIPEFAGFLESKSFPFPMATVWAITVFELGASLLLLLDIKTRLVSLGLIILLLVGIIIIHLDFGWFVGEHGSGGSEYSVVLIVALLVVGSGSSRNK